MLSLRDTSVLLVVLMIIVNLLANKSIASNPVFKSQQLPTIQIIQTAQNTKDRLTPIGSISFEKTIPNMNDNLVLLNPKDRKQKIIGFGCAMTEASSFVFSTMNEDIKRQILDLYWSPKGLNYTVGRIPMNSCDFSLGTYSCDDVKGDYDLKFFNINRDKLFKYPLVSRVVNNTKAFNGKPLKLFLSPWSPPAWMKINNDMNGSATPNGLINDTRILDSWALYYSKYITAYKELGVPFWGLTVQNEPEYAAPYEACVYTAEFQRDFIKRHLGPRIKKDHPEVNILIYDHNRDHIHLWAEIIYSDKEASKYVAGTAFHWYVDGQYEHLTMAHDIAPEKILIASEATQGPNVVLGDWGRGESYGFDIINDLENYAQGWTDWNCILDPIGGPTHMQNWCDAAIVANNKTQSIYLQPMYYYMGHFSKYLTEGSVRIAHESTLATLLVTSFITPENKMVVIVMNQEQTSQVFKLVDMSIGIDYAAEMIVPPHSIRTLIYDHQL